MPKTWINGIEYEAGSPEALAAHEAIERAMAAEYEEAMAREAAMVAPLSADECLRAIIAAVPSLTESLPDEVAARMAPWLPDASEVSATGALAVMDGAVVRKVGAGRLASWASVAGADAGLQPVAPARGEAS